jgi:hypothetical protein
MPRAFTRSLREAAFFVGVAFFVILAAFPFYWMVITAFKQNSDLYDVTNVPFWFNEPPTLEHLTYLFRETLFARWLLNSLIIGVCVTVITLVTAVPAGYSLARMTSRKGEALGIAIFLTYLVPPTLLFLPLSRIIAEFGLQNSMWSLVLVYPTFTIPFCSWLLMGFFKALPPGGDRRWLQSLRRLHQNGDPAVAARDPDSGDLHVHADIARICLRADLCVFVFAEADHAWGVDRPDSRRRVLLGRDHGRCVDRRHSGGRRL